MMNAPDYPTLAKGDSDHRHYGWILAGIVLLGLAVRLAVSATTFGTNDIVYFSRYAAVIRVHGPIAIYHVHFKWLPYNHPPLIGLLLGAVNWLHDRGFSFQFALRLFPIVADCGSALLMADIFRRHGGPRKALLIAAAIALNPVLILISGFHGNIDTVFCFLLLLSLYLMVERGRPIAAGAAGAVAVGVKLIPLIVIPLIILSARNRKDAFKYTAGLAVTSALIWGAALVREWHGVLSQVFGYRGQYGAWGVGRIARLLGISTSALTSARGTLGIITVIVATVIGIWYATRAHRSPYAAAGLALATMLLLIPAWGDQYLVWPVIFLFFIDSRLAILYSVVTGAFLFETYTVWSHMAFPWHREAIAGPLDTWGTILGFASWALLAGTILYAVVRSRRAADRDVVDAANILTPV
jgi:hypothetical protein